MRVLSFDVGIKNLAYCVIEWNDSNDDLKIHKWNIINVVESKANTDNVCNNCISPDCKGKIKSYIQLNDVKYHFCSKHLKDKDSLLEPILSSYNEDKWSDIDDSICCKCKTKSKLKSNPELNLVFCSKHFKAFNDKNNNAKDKLIPVKNKKVKDISSDDLKFHLIKCLDQRKEILLTNIDMVLIENQPTFKNPTMKAISDTLYTWFLIRGKFDKEINNSSIDKIKFISPSNKLKEFNKQTITEASDAKKYSETKKLSIANTNSILLSYKFNEWSDFFSSQQKKDDLADSFLQGWYILNSHYNNKLYNQWQELYNKVVVITQDAVEEKIKKRSKKIKENQENVENQEIIKVKTRSRKKKEENILDLRTIVDV